MDVSSIEAAALRIAPYIRPTPLTYDPANQLYLKWENQQVTGSFKARGAFNKILSLPKADLQKGLVTASAGNHGQGVALAAQKAGAKATIFASDHAVAAKVEAMRRLGAEVRLVPGGYGEAEQAGLEYARQSQAVWISPYNDELVIAGQGTLGLEILAALPADVKSTWIIPTGGGGLAAGVGLAAKTARPAQPPARVVGVQSTASPFFYALYYQGTQAGVAELPSLADGLAGPVEEGSLTIEMVQHWLDAVVLVSEEEISQAIYYAWKQYGQKIEGSAATALAAALTGRVPERPAVIIISGGNIQPELHGKITGEERE